MKYLITGFPGTGKSTIAKALQEKGLKTYDIETMDGYTHLTNRKTGEPISLPKNPERGWFDKIGRVDFDLPKVNKLLDIDQDVFIFMLMDNQQDHYELFDKIFLLTVDDDTLLNRLNSRKDTGFGKHPNTIADTIELRHDFDQKLLEHGAIRLDSSIPIESVVDDIICQLS